MANAQHDFESVVPSQLPDSLKALYFDAGRQMYSYIGSFFPTFPSVSSAYKSKSMNCQMEYLTYASPIPPNICLIGVRTSISKANIPGRGTY